MTAQIKPVFTNSLYAVIKQGSRWIVVLVSNPRLIQYSGARDWCISWARENGLETA
jgi:hypothetical protein